MRGGEEQVEDGHSVIGADIRGHRFCGDVGQRSLAYGSFRCEMQHEKLPSALEEVLFDDANTNYGIFAGGHAA